jgi:hypothetical protein
LIAALNFSAGVQVDALTKIADLTFSSDMPPGKFLAVVVQAGKKRHGGDDDSPEA